MRAAVLDGELSLRDVPAPPNNSPYARNGLTTWPLTSVKR